MEWRSSRWPSWGSCSCRSTAWAPTTARRRFTTWRGRTSATRVSPIAFSGTRRSRQSTGGTTSRVWDSTARPPADRTRWADCSFIQSSIKSPTPILAATTTGWTRSGGTSSGWAGRSGPSTPRRPTWRTRANSRAPCCSSSAKWTPTSIPRRRCRWSTS